MKPNTLTRYLFALKTYYIDYRLSLKSFDNPQMILIIKKAKKLFPRTKKNRLPFTKYILERIMEDEILKIDEFNLDIAF